MHYEIFSEGYLGTQISSDPAKCAEQATTDHGPSTNFCSAEEVGRKRESTSLVLKLCRAQQELCFYLVAYMEIHDCVGQQEVTSKNPSKFVITEEQSISSTHLSKSRCR